MKPMRNLALKTVERSPFDHLQNDIYICFPYEYVGVMLSCWMDEKSRWEFIRRCHGIGTTEDFVARSRYLEQG